MSSAINLLFQAHRLNDKTYIQWCINYIKKLNILQLYVVYTFADNNTKKTTQNPLMYNYCITIMRYCWQLINGYDPRFAARLFRPLSCAQVHQLIKVNTQSTLSTQNTQSIQNKMQAGQKLPNIKHENSWKNVELATTHYIKLEKI